MQGGGETAHLALPQALPGVQGQNPDSISASVFHAFPISLKFFSALPSTALNVCGPAYSGLPQDLLTICRANYTPTSPDHTDGNQCLILVLFP